jgi:uncharacterized LabA/DUF88 family protein
MEKIFLAIFIDIENIPSKLNLEVLMNSLILSEQSNYNFVFAHKATYGALNSISSELKTQLRDYNFSMQEKPHIGSKKNRADLFISIDAFETLYVNNPKIDRYIFVTSDSDFTVVMDKLRKYGKEVWLVCRKDDEERQILAKSCDKMLFLEDFYQSDSFSGLDEKAKREYIEDNDKKARELFKEVLSSIDLERLPYNISVINDRMKQLDKSFDIKYTSYKRFGELARYFEKSGIIRVDDQKLGFPTLIDIDLSRIEQENLSALSKRDYSYKDAFRNRNVVIGNSNRYQILKNMVEKIDGKITPSDLADLAEIPNRLFKSFIKILFNLPFIEVSDYNTFSSPIKLDVELYKKSNLEDEINKYLIRKLQTILDTKDIDIVELSKCLYADPDHEQYLKDLLVTMESAGQKVEARD